MKGLLKYLSPFAPDQSGAAAVFYDMNCVIVICDAGGCTGNICGFDEPRWYGRKSPIFSAGLRDMDAILGRDDKLLEKLKLILEKSDSEMAVLIGTPVPAVIGQDLKALKKMASKRVGSPVLAVECTGTKLYDEGASAAYLEICSFYAEKQKLKGEQEDSVGILGCLPLEMPFAHAEESVRKAFGTEYKNSYVFGNFKETQKIVSGCVMKNIVVSPAGLGAARYLKEKYGTPYEIKCPLPEICLPSDLKNKKVLIVHQQVICAELKKIIPTADTASFFMIDDEICEETAKIEKEDELCEIVNRNGYDVIIADPMLKRPLKDFDGEWIELKHPAISGCF